MSTTTLVFSELQTNKQRSHERQERRFFNEIWNELRLSRICNSSFGVSTNHHENCLKEFLILSFRLLTFIAGVLAAVAAGLLLVFCGAAALAFEPSAFTSRAH